MATTGAAERMTRSGSKKEFRPFVKTEHNEHNVRIENLDFPVTYFPSVDRTRL